MIQCKSKKANSTFSFSVLNSALFKRHLKSHLHGIFRNALFLSGLMYKQTSLSVREIVCLVMPIVKNISLIRHWINIKLM